MGELHPGVYQPGSGAALSSADPSVAVERLAARSRVAAELAAGTLLLSLPALINGYALAYPDTGAYVQQAIGFHSAPGRPPYYSLLIFPLHLRLSLWPIPVVQSLAVATVLRSLLHWTVGQVRSLEYLVLVTLLAALTSVGWHTGQIMPDIYTGLLPILVFLIGWTWEDQSRRARVVLVVSTCGMATLHYTHLPLTAGLFAAAALGRWLQGATRGELRRIGAIGATAVLACAASFVLYSLALVRRPVLSPDGSLFLAARVLADGPGRDWLAAHCPGSGNAFCDYRLRIPSDADTFLWDKASPLRSVLQDIGPAQTKHAAAEIVAGTISTAPAAEVRHALANSEAQLLRFGTLDTECPEHCGPDNATTQTIERYFPREYQQFRHSLQMTGRLPVGLIRRVDSVVIIVTAMTALVVLIVAVRRRDHKTEGLLGLVAATLVLNAFVCGSLSGPHDRYQSRVIWLLPLGALLGLDRLWLSRERPAFLKLPTLFAVAPTAGAANG